MKAGRPVDPEPFRDTGGAFVVVNATDYADLEIVVTPDAVGRTRPRTPRRRRDFLSGETIDLDTDLAERGVPTH